MSASTTGAPGQYVTIFGDNFGSAVGTVIFADEDSGDVTFVPSFPPQCSLSWWSDTAIVVQVPSGLSVSPTFNPKTIRVRAAGYPLVRESNTKEFTVDDIAVAPGLCAVTPSAGPVGTPVTVYGDNLGASASDFEIRFYNGSILPPSVPALSSTETYVSNQEVGASVPSGAATGPLSAVVNVSSNTLNFTVGDCTVVPNICSATQACCPSGACATTLSACPGAPSVDAQYVYGFTTGPIPNLPTVIELCNGSYLSPTPSTLFADGTAACVNANVLVAFSPGAPAASMNISTLENPNNVYVEHCVGNGLDPCEAVEEDAEDNSIHLAGILSATPTTVSFDPNVPLLQNAWYRVTVKGDVVNVNGVALAEDYVFRFKTRDDATECEVEDLLVS
ncbi:MAG: IPT/TIG domain-containing protein, partial [Fibrobacterota bacterium]